MHACVLSAGVVPLGTLLATFGCNATETVSTNLVSFCSIAHLAVQENASLALTPNVNMQHRLHDGVQAQFAFKPLSMGMGNASGPEQGALSQKILA